MSGKRRPVLKVVFDTSSIKAGGSESLLLRPSVSEFIEKHSQDSDLSVEWYLPDVVLKEREYQMQEAAKELLSAKGMLQRFKGLTGISVDMDLDAINLGAIKEGVSRKIKEQTEEHGVKTLELKTKEVDWDELIDRAVFRHRPFQRGKNEKGFRDALIAETFLHLANSCTSAPEECQLVLVTGDRLLQEAVEEQIRNPKNAKVFQDLKQLENLINTLATNMESFEAENQADAASFFFKEGDTTTLFYKMNIAQDIWEKLSAEFRWDLEYDARPHIRDPLFKNKQDGRVWWVSRISIEVQVYEHTYPTSLLPRVNPLLEATGNRGDSEAPSPAGVFEPSSRHPKPSTPASFEIEQRDNPSYRLLRDDLETYYPTGSPGFRQLVGEWSSDFDVTWSVTVDSRRNFHDPKIESIEPIGTTWRQPEPAVDNLREYLRQTRDLLT